MCSDYKINDECALLDLNENAYGPALPATFVAHDLGVNALHMHRYPDRPQRELKQQLCNFRNTHVHTEHDLSPDNVVLGVGSVEAIDAVIRCFCIPGKDRILTCPPAYGMYAVSAQVNDVGVVEVPLLSPPSFALDVPAINLALSNDASIKLTYVASPGNPTGSLLSKADVEQILTHPTWNGVVVLDEAYIDFAPDDASFAGLVMEYPNLVVLHTLSKAFGMAGIRVGAAYAPTPIASLLNNLKAPWSIPSPSSALASYTISQEGLFVMRQNRNKVKIQRDRLLKELPDVDGVGRIRCGTSSNFLLFEVLNSCGHPDNLVAVRVYDKLAKTKGVVVRFRGKEVNCHGCLRITVGTGDEITKFLNSLREVLADVRGKKTGSKWTEVEARDSGIDVSCSSSSPSSSAEDY
ncbi:histidinol-phosphate transaminase [Ascochyta clinopodiicola]|nr:histidinol-phosphate transaminase [Ascochyta clinopodiicola]